jgi:hypothetical protein
VNEPSESRLPESESSGTSTTSDIQQVEDDRILGEAIKQAEQLEEAKATPNGFRRPRTSKHRLQRRPKKKRR